MEFWQSIAFTETDQLIEIAQIAEEVGYEGLGIAEHLVTPEVIESRYPYSPDGSIWWDPNAHFPEPWTLATVLASHTTTLRFVTTVYLLPMRDVFTASKSVSTAAFMSGNRMVLGVGVGWMAEEFALTGQDYRTRGRRTDEMLDVMQRLFTGEMVSYQGQFHDFPPVRMEPAPTAPVPVYIGGDSEPALRRAARWDGWFGAGPYGVDDAIGHVRRLRQIRSELGLSDDGYGMVVGLVDPDLDAYRRLADEGVTGAVSIPWYYQGTPTSTIGWKREQMERFAEEYIEPLR